MTSIQIPHNEYVSSEINFCLQLIIKLFKKANDEVHPITCHKGTGGG
jgi:hypothetical protein